MISDNKVSIVGLETKVNETISMVVDNRKPKTISVVINNPTNNAHKQVNTHEDIINQRLNESELDLNSKVIRFTSGDPLPSNYPPREENLPNKIIADKNPRKPEIVHFPNKLIKLVKPVSTGFNNIENVYIDKDKIRRALQKLKENAGISINGTNIQNSPYVEEETEIVESKTETFHVWIDKDTSEKNKNHTQPSTNKETAEKLDPVSNVALAGWYGSIANTITGYLELGFMVDAHLQGEDGCVVPAHQVILAHISPLLADMLLEARREDESVIIMLPSVPTSYIRDFIHAVYTGYLPTNMKTINNVFMVANLLKVKLPGSKEKKGQTSNRQPTNVKIKNVKENVKASPEVSTYKLANNDNINLFSLDSSTYEISEVCVDEPLDQHDNVDFHFVDINDDAASADETDSSLVHTIHLDDSQQFQSNQLNNKPENVKEISQNAKSNEDKVSDKENTALKYLRPVDAVKIFNISSEIIQQQQQKQQQQISEIIQQQQQKQQQQIRTNKRKKLTSNKSKTSKKSKKSSSDGNVTYQPADKLCPLCNKPRINHKNREISENQKGCHKGNYYKCCQCSASKLSAKKLFPHLENHIAKKFKCSQCNKGYSYKNLLTEHEYKIHGDGKNQRYPCPYDGCDYDARYKQTLHTHITDHHKEKVKGKFPIKIKITCPKCKKMYKRQHYFSYHKKNCTVSTDGKYECSVCYKKHNSKLAMNKHMHTKHAEPGTQTNHNCNICSKTYSSQYTLYNHRLLYHGVNSKGEKVPRKLFACHQCGKVLTTSVKLKTHIEVIHMGIKHFTCKYCSKQFTSKSNLSVHEGAQHTGILPYSCEDCDKSFGRKSQLRLHREQVHGIPMESDRLFSPGFVPPQSLALVSHTTDDNQTLISNQQIIINTEHHAFEMISDASVVAENLASQVIEDARFNTGSQTHIDDEVPELKAAADKEKLLLLRQGANNQDGAVGHVIMTGIDSTSAPAQGIHDDEHDGIHELEASAEQGIHDDHHGIVDDDVLNDGHYYVVDDLNTVEAVQVGDVIIPVELVSNDQVDIRIPDKR